MKYKDLICSGTHEDLRWKCLVWSEHYETAIFDIEDEIHPESKWVWFEVKFKTAPNLIVKILVSTGRILESCSGKVPFKNEVVFTKYPKCLHVASAAGNTAEAVFPQNMGVRNTGEQMFTERLIKKRFGMYCYGLGANDE